jgi:kynureninase
MTSDNHPSDRSRASTGDYHIGALQYARALDAQDPLAAFTERFFSLSDTIYMDGNSLGLMSRDAEKSLQRIAEEWKQLGIGGWLHGEHPWFRYSEYLAEKMAPLMGASPEEITLTGSTTVNLHALLTAFYRPEGRRRKIVMDELNFPSDIYAAKGFLALMGADPERDLVLVKSRDGKTLEEEDIAAAFDKETAVAVLPAVLYRSGQLLDVAHLTAEAHRSGVRIGFDCSHSAGAVPHRLSEADADFAFWCTYKYLNGGPGSVAALFVNKRNLPALPRLNGWWGNKKETMFDMSLDFDPRRDAGVFQVGSPHMLSLAPLEGSLTIFEEAGIERLREKSLGLTEYLISLADELLPESRTGYRIGTPREAHRRGGHVAVEHPEAVRITEALKARGVVPDFRRPDVIRLAPVPLYTGYEDVLRTVRHLQEIVETEEWKRYSADRGEVA